MAANPCVEFHPENGDAPWVVVFRMDGRELWFAHQNEESARTKISDDLFVKLCRRYEEYRPCMSEREYNAS